MPVRCPNNTFPFCVNFAVLTGAVTCCLQGAQKSHSLRKTVCNEQTNSCVCPLPLRVARVEGFNLYAALIFPEI